MEMCIFLMSIIVVAGFAVVLKLIGDMEMRVAELSAVIDELIDEIGPPSEMTGRQV